MIDPGNPMYYGLGQFLPSTWILAGGGDPYSPYQQGYNMGHWIQGTNIYEQWPVCSRS